MATTAAPYGFWATNPTKKLAHWVYLLGQPLSRNRVFQNFSGEPPLKKCTHFGRKMGVATTAAPYGFWATNPTKKLAHWVYLLGQPLSRNRVFQNFTCGMFTTAASLEQREQQIRWRPFITLSNMDNVFWHDKARSNYA